MTPDPGREESPQERADRNFGEILQELRVTETGVQILFSLLLTVPFSARFHEVTPFQRRVYLVALLLSAAASVCCIAPVAYHRLLFRLNEKAQIVQASSRIALVGLVLLLLAVTSVLLLIGDVLLGTVPGALLAAGFGVATIALWFVPPALLRRRAPR